jgi:endonuclease-3
LGIREQDPLAKSGQKPGNSTKKSTAPKAAPWLVSSPAWDRVDPVLQQRLMKLKPKKALAERALKIADALAMEFPDATCALHHKNALQLLVATILSAQCTDERVNMVTPALFKKYPKAHDFATAPPGELENDIRSTGFFNNKAKAIRAACADIDERFGGKVPEAMDDLLTLRGVARKTANVVRINCFGYPGLTVDTHFLRITKRLGLTEQEDQEKVEADVASLLPPDRWSHFCHAIILHGRKTCKARKPACDACPLVPLCPSAFKV